ncbi:helicase SRCAP [Spea bombifrons]|uniref:helicase SRCAP n=1 Tax=Spea bombifrons TaxID=233779 RepID=UPI00234B95C5|nr:helicase SRCAP [Spea bombifrons]
MQSCPVRELQASHRMTGSNPMSPGSSGDLSPFDLSGEMGEAAPGSPTCDVLDGSQQDTPSGQKWDSHTEIAEQAKHEAEIENRIAELRKEGFWTPRRLSKVPEPTRPKVHWDYLCEEMQWLSADFGQERRWKRGVARKVVRMVARHHEELKQKEERARREEQAKLRRIANSIAKEVRQFWSNVEKVVQFKQQSRLEEKRKKALDLQLDFIVGQTEKYSDLLSQSLSEALPASKTSSSCIGSSQGGSLGTSPAPSVCPREDDDFLPHEEEDDEETIEMEEQQDGHDAESHRLEIELLKRESEVPLEELLQSLPPEILEEEDLEKAAPRRVTPEADEDDDEFTANEEEAEDEEETIAAQEELEGQQDHTEELDQLAREGEMSLEDLLKKYSWVHPEEETRDPDGESHGSDQTSGSSGESSDSESEGVECLLKSEEDFGVDPIHPEEPKKEITDIAATAESLQPKGYTLATTQVKTAVPFLLRGDLREYQHIGLEWLVTMYEKKLNGILADEMGLGKTIQTISLLAHLACERGNWGPHLIIVPTSVILNWEMELKRWCPSFKILTYYGSQKERKLKRQGWTKVNAFHVCITSYKLVLQDHQAFRRKNWVYLILDEAQNIKNFKSQRWQSLLNFNSQRRLLLTGTPLQNSLMELWSLMHFLMPHVFQSHREFKEWFSNPLTGMIEGSQEYNEGLVRRLHKVLRPFLLRRIKADVEKQMPKKYEHVIYCRLSKRQRFLYDDFMAQAATRETLASGHFMSVINILMQLRKVCNHPNLFDPRPIHSPFITSTICYSVPSLVLRALQRHPLQHVEMSMFDLIGLEGRVSRYESDVFLPQYKPTRSLIQEIADSPEPPPRPRPLRMKVNRMHQPVAKPDPRTVVVVNSSRPVQKPPAQASSISPPQQPPASLPPVPTAAAGASGPVQHQVSVPAAPVVQSPPGPVSVSPMSAGLVKPISLPASQPGHSAPQRLILTPDMQARLPSGEVITLSQLASLSGRPQVPAATKPLTLQLHGGKLTLSGAQVRQLVPGQHRPVQGNVLHLVSSGGQHHLLSQPAQLALIQALAQQAAASAPSVSPQMGQGSGAAQLGVQTVSLQSLPHSLLTGAGIPAASASVIPPPGQVSAPGLVKIVVRQAARETSAPPPRPLLRVAQSTLTENASACAGIGERSVPVVATSSVSLASSSVLMVSSPAPRFPCQAPSPVPSHNNHAVALGAEGSPGVALRLLTTATSAALQITNHRSSPPSHSQSPVLPNCSPAQSAGLSNCSPCQLVTQDSTLDASAASNGIGPNGAPPPQSAASQDPKESVNTQSLSQCVPASSSGSSPSLSAPTPSPSSNHAVNLPKLTSSSYSLSLVPALLANSAASTSSMPARFLTSPVSLLTLSPLPTTTGASTPLIYTHASANALPPIAHQASPFPAATISAPQASVPPPPMPSTAPQATLLASGLSSLVHHSPVVSVPTLTQPPVPVAPASPVTPSLAPAIPMTPALAPTQVSVSPTLLPAQAPLPAPVAPVPLQALAAPSPLPLPTLAASISVPFSLLAASAPETLPSLVLSTQLPSMSTSATAPSALLPAVAAPASLPLLACSDTAPLSLSLPLPRLSVSLPLSTTIPVLATTSASSSLPVLASGCDPAPLATLAAPICTPQPPTSAPPALPAPRSVSLTSILNRPPVSSVPVCLPSLTTTTAPTRLPSLAASPVARLPSPSVTVSTHLLSLAAPASVPLPVLASSAPLPVLASSASAPLPVLASSASAPLPVLASSASAPLPVLASSASAPLPVLASSASAPLPVLASSASAPLPVLASSASAPLPVLASSASAPLPVLASSASAPLPVLASSASAPLPVLASSASAPLPVLASSASAPLPVLASSASAPLPVLASSASAPLPVLASSASAPLPVLASPASAPLPVLASPASAPLPVLASPASAPLPVLASPASAPLPVLASPASIAFQSVLPSLASTPASTSAISLVTPVLAPVSSSSAALNQTNTATSSAISAPVSLSIQDPPLSLSVAGPPSVSVTLSTAAEADTLLDADGFRSTCATTVPASVRTRRQPPPPPRSPFYLEPVEERRRRQKVGRLDRIFRVNEQRCGLAPVYGTEVLRFCTLPDVHWSRRFASGRSAPRDLYDYWLQTDALRESVLSPQQRLEQLEPLVDRFIFAMPPVEAPLISLHTSHPPPSLLLQESVFKETLYRELTPRTRCLHRIVSNMRTQFPDLRLIQYDCGKLQTLDRLLRQLKSGGHRVLIFTQMTRMLDVLEQFLNYHGHIYLRLDGSTRVEQRQVLMERFNMDRRIFCFILSTRSGGVGVNLTGADTVIFYDSDWNPTMDAQAQDRCHRIGQTRDVHIYRLVSDRTVEENILKKAQQKRMLGDLAIEGGNFTTAYFKQQTIRELFDMEDAPSKEIEAAATSPERSVEDGGTARTSQILEQALCGAEDEEDKLAASLVRAEQVADLAEFNENAPLEPEEEEQSRVEQEITALVEQLTPIERYAMYYLEASLEDVSREELKQAEEQVEAARKDLYMAKDDGGHYPEERWEEESKKVRKVRAPPPPRTPGERIGVRMSERLRGGRLLDAADADNPVVHETSALVQECVQGDTLQQDPLKPPDRDFLDPSVFCGSSESQTLPEHLLPQSTTPVTQPQEIADPEVDDSTQEDYGRETVVSDVERQPVPNVVTTVSSSSICVSQGEESIAPRTPRRKVTADCEILLAGAGDSSPTAKVLRRLPGRLVTVVQDRPLNRQSRGRTQRSAAERGAQSPPPDLQSDETSDTGSPPPKRKRGRPPKARTDQSPPPASLDILPTVSSSPEMGSSSQETSPELGSRVSGSPKPRSRFNSESESGSPNEKRKRGRPPKRRDGSVTSVVTSAAESPAPDALSLADTVSTPSLVRLDHKEDSESAISGHGHLVADVSIPSAASDIPQEGAGSSGADEPPTPSKRKRGRPPKPSASKGVASPLHNDKADSSPDRSPSPHVTRTPVRQKGKPLKTGTSKDRVHSHPPPDTDSSSGAEELPVRTPFTRSASTRLQPTQTPHETTPRPGLAPKTPRGRSPRAVPVHERPSTKRRKPPAVGSPSPPSSSPHGSSSERQAVGGRKRPCPPAERVLRSSLTASPASNTRSLRPLPPLHNSPSSHRGRKAKT